MGLYRRPGSRYWWIAFKLHRKLYRLSTGVVAGARTRAEGERAGRAKRVEIEQRVGRRRQRGEGARLMQLHALDTDRAIAAGVTEAQLEAIDTHWTRLQEGLGPDVDCARLARADLDAYVRTRREAGTRAQTIRRELGALRRGLALGVERGLSVAEIETWPKLSDDEPNELNTGKRWAIEDVHAVLAGVPEHARDLLLFAAHTGVRLEEARRVQPEWLRRIEAGPPGLVGALDLPTTATKTRKPRSVGLSAEAWDAAQRALARGDGPDGLVFSQANHARALMLASAKAGHVELNPETRQRLKGRRLTFRDLRHTFASVASELQPLANVQGALGHDRATTTDRYISAHDAAVLGVGPAVAGAYGGRRA